MHHTNYDLGLKIHQLLHKNNLENPANWQFIDLWQDKHYLDQQTEKLTDFIQNLGLDLYKTSLANTPQRMVRLFIENLFWGLDYHNFPNITVDDNSFAYTSPLVSKNIRFLSTCEHHFVAINGNATIAYIPRKKIVGLGILNHIVNFFAHRPQVQERLTRQIFTVLQYVLDTPDVAVALNAHHDCITRGNVGAAGNEVFSIELGGNFLDDATLNTNFYTLAGT